MKNKKKLFNDPIYGLIQFEEEILYELIEHPYFQRLRRISQLGLSNYVYPGATHSRFQHALGALHLMSKALQTLKNKGVIITDEESEGAKIAILLHDIGHGPYSHVLEHTFIKESHEEISLAIMQKLNLAFNGRLDLAIAIFKGEYHKQFLSQLVASELDVDRLDYLNRDSFFTGVAEGVIGYDRILHMINVQNNRLVVEEKGKYSIEKFLIARRLMYSQVYLHKTVIAIDQMLISFLQRYNEQYILGKTLENNNFTLLFDLYAQKLPVIDTFLLLDDVDVMQLLKSKMSDEDPILRYLSRCIVNRHIFNIYLSEDEITSDFVKECRQKVVQRLNLKEDEIKYFILTGVEKIKSHISKDEICIIDKSKNVKPVSDYLVNYSSEISINKNYICFPNNDYFRA